MWAQVIKIRVKPGKEDQVGAVFDALRETEQPGSGLVRTSVMRDQKDPSVIWAMPVFESEAAARARENDPVRQEQLRDVRRLMGEVFEEPEFTDLEVLSESQG